MLLEAHAEWGTAAYDRFNGMFAFAIHDAHTGTVTIARDHFGIKPLYYWVDPTTGTSTGVGTPGSSSAPRSARSWPPASSRPRRMTVRSTAT